MDGVPGQALADVLSAALDPASTASTAVAPLPLLAEVPGIRAVLATGPDGAFETIAQRPGDVPALVALTLPEEYGRGDTDRTTEVPGEWAEAGISTLAVHRISPELGSVAVAWERPPSAGERAQVHLVLALLGERWARERAEDHLADLTARVNNAQRLANMGDYDWHIASDTNRWSDQLYAIYGHEPQSFNASYERFLAHLHPEDRERIQEIHRRAYETGEPYEMIERIVRPDGELRYLSSNGQVVRDQSGTPIRMRGTCIDITDRVLAEQARERLSRRFRSLVESCPDAILVLDAAGVIVQANRGAHELLGGDPIGTAAETVARFDAAAHDVEARGLDGRPLQLDVITAELHDVDGEGLIAVYLRDAAARHADEARAAALREAQVRHRQALEINDDVIQGLTAAILATQLNDIDSATTYLEQTLTAARRLMNDWAGSAQDAAIRPGSLMRSVPSTLPPPRAVASNVPPPTVSPRILVVDDNADVRTLLCAQLLTLGRGTVVGQAANGMEAIELAERLQPDLVFLDLSMPDMDGLEALPHILGAVPGVKVVVMSGFDERTVGAQVLASGATRYVEKGLRMNLGAVIDELYQAA